MYEMGGGSVMMQAGGSGRQPGRHRDVGAVVMARLVSALRSDFSPVCVNVATLWFRVREARRCCTPSYISTPKKTLFPVSQTVRAEPC